VREKRKGLAQAVRGVSMTDVEEEMEVLQRKLAAKTQEVEALVAKQQHLGDLNKMDSTDYDRFRIYVEELIYRWQEADVRPSLSNPDTALNRLIAEREEIEQQIVELQVR
jgi:hypothetical protein